jgi:hypothetical protein
MRTTLTLEPDVARLIEEEAHRRRKSVKEVVNDAIRKGLASRVPAGSRLRRYRVNAHVTTLRPGIDPGSFDKLADELEDEVIAAKMRQPL